LRCNDTKLGLDGFCDLPTASTERLWLEASNTLRSHLWQKAHGGLLNNCTDLQPKPIPIGDYCL
jgi:hypothetical protein